MKNEINAIKTFAIFLADLMAMEIPTIVVETNGKTIDLDEGFVDDEFFNKDVKGKFYFHENTIYLNADNHKNMFDVLASLIHEMRHAYQLYAIKHNLEEKDLLQAWEKCFDKPLTSKQKGYANQPIELDAFAFTNYLTQVIFSKKIILNEKHNKKLYQENFERIAHDFSVDEIEDCLSYVGVAFLS